MKNTLWRFGDSWSTTKSEYNDIELNHSVYIAEHFGMDLKHLGTGGFGNLSIFKEILSNSTLYKQNDIILVNFASINRIEIIENNKIFSTSNIIDEYDMKSKVLGDVLINDFTIPISDILFHLINSYFQNLIDNGIKVYHFYLDNIKDYKIPNHLKFKSSMCSFGFIGWCKNNNYEDLSPAGNVHYKLGSQKEIANKIIEKIESL